MDWQIDRHTDQQTNGSIDQQTNGTHKMKDVLFKTNIKKVIQSTAGLKNKKLCDNDWFPSLLRSFLTSLLCPFLPSLLSFPLSFLSLFPSSHHSTLFTFSSLTDRCKESYWQSLASLKSWRRWKSSILKWRSEAGGVLAADELDQRQGTHRQVNNCPFEIAPYIRSLNIFFHYNYLIWWSTGVILGKCQRFFKQIENAAIDVVVFLGCSQNPRVSVHRHWCPAWMPIKGDVWIRQRPQVNEIFFCKLC